MGRRIPLGRVLGDLIKKGRIPGPPPGGYRWLHGLALSGIIPADQDPHTLRWDTDEDDLPRIAEIICAALPDSTPLPFPEPQDSQPSKRARRAAAVAA
jgi:hypothetical protein